MTDVYRGQNFGVCRAHAVIDGRRLGQLAKPSGPEHAQRPTVPIFVGYHTLLQGCALLGFDDPG